MSQAHLPCPDCGSSDALMINDDGSTKCFSCGTFTPSKEDVPQVSQKDAPKEFLKGYTRNIDARCLKQETCRKYKYNTGTYKGKEVQIATYRDLDGNPVFQKIRFVEDKQFMIIGKFKPLLYGMHLFRGNTKKLIITEGEIDCLSVSQVVNGYPVVSIPNGANNAKEAIKHNLEWLEKFEEVVFCFDMDDAGQKAVKECAALLSIGKAKIMSLPMKDPNEMLKAGHIDELYKATWNGVEYRPDGIVTGAELRDIVKNKKIEYGLSYPFPRLTELTYGIRTSEMIVFGAGTGMGKTEFFKEIEAHLLLEHKQKIGIIHLEEQTPETVLGLMSKYSSIKFHLPTAEYTQEQYDEALDAVTKENRVFIYDSFGTTDLDTIKNTIRYMVKEKIVSMYFLTISLLLEMVLKMVIMLINICEKWYRNWRTSQESWILPYLQYRISENLMAKNLMKKVEGFTLMIYMVLLLLNNGQVMSLVWRGISKLWMKMLDIQLHLDALKTDIQDLQQDRLYKLNTIKTPEDWKK